VVLSAALKPVPGSVLIFRMKPIQLQARKSLQIKISFTETPISFSKVNAPSQDEVKILKDGSALISFLYAYTNPELVDELLKKISSFAMDTVPRISRAQKMDALSSQANLGGYKAVLLGANALGKINYLAGFCKEIKDDF